MHKYTGFFRIGIGCNIIRVVVFNLEVVDANRAFEKFMLNLLDYDILPVYRDENIACSQFDSFRPTLLCYIERMGWSGRYCIISGIRYMNKFIRFTFEGLSNSLIATFTGFRIGGINVITHFYIFNRNLTIIG